MGLVEKIKKKNRINTEEDDDDDEKESWKIFLKGEAWEKPKIREKTLIIQSLSLPPSSALHDFIR